MLKHREGISLEELALLLASGEYTCDYDHRKNCGVVYVWIRQEELLGIGWRKTICEEYRIEEGSELWDAFWEAIRKRGRPR